MKNVMCFVGMKKVIVPGGLTKLIKDWKVTEVVSARYDIIVRADSQDGAIELAQSIPKDKWNDLTDERVPDEVEAEEYE